MRGNGKSCSLSITIPTRLLVVYLVQETVGGKLDVFQAKNQAATGWTGVQAACQLVEITVRPPWRMGTRITRFVDTNDRIWTLIWRNVISIIFTCCFHQGNTHFMRKIPAGAEASNILVGEVDFLDKTLSAFIRLSQAGIMGDLTEVPVPTRFIFVLLGPTVRFRSEIL